MLTIYRAIYVVFWVIIHDKGPRLDLDNFHVFYIILSVDHESERIFSRSQILFEIFEFLRQMSNSKIAYNFKNTAQKSTLLRMLIDFQHHVPIISNFN
jgi:hypothetical protein